jgi:hypothetical protein
MQSSPETATAPLPTEPASLPRDRASTLKTTSNKVESKMGISLLNMVSQQLSLQKLDPSPTKETLHQTPDRVIHKEDISNLNDGSNESN